MKLTLMGPDDQGFWYLADRTGRDFRIIERREDHAAAAKLFGWSPSSDSLTTDQLNEDARGFLMENVGSEITAPLHIAERFSQ